MCFRALHGGRDLLKYVHQATYEQNNKVACGNQMSVACLPLKPIGGEGVIGWKIGYLYSELQSKMICLYIIILSVPLKAIGGGGCD